MPLDCASIDKILSVLSQTQNDDRLLRDFLQCTGYSCPVFVPGSWYLTFYILLNLFLFIPCWDWYFYDDRQKYEEHQIFLGLILSQIIHWFSAGPQNIFYFHFFPHFLKHGKVVFYGCRTMEMLLLLLCIFLVEFKVKNNYRGKLTKQI